MNDCVHMNFAADVKVARLEGKDGIVRQFQADVTIKCADCGRQFQFLGLAPGLDLADARCSVDGLEARLSILPQGATPNQLDRIMVNIGGAAKLNS